MGEQCTIIAQNDIIKCLSRARTLIIFCLGLVHWEHGDCAVRPPPTGGVGPSQEDQMHLVTYSSSSSSFFETIVWRLSLTLNPVKSVGRAISSGSLLFDLSAKALQSMGSSALIDPRNFLGSREWWSAAAKIARKIVGRLRCERVGISPVLAIPRSLHIDVQGVTTLVFSMPIVKLSGLIVFIDSFQINIWRRNVMTISLSDSF